MARVCPFRSLLLDISDGLTEQDLDKLIFLSKDKIGSQRESDDISSGLDLFEVFIKRDVINKECIDYLADLLSHIRRFDLRRVLCKKLVILRQACVDNTPTTVGTNHSLQIGPMGKKVCLQEQTTKIPNHCLAHTVPEVQIDGLALSSFVKDGEQLRDGNEQESVLPVGASLSTKCITQDALLRADTINRRTDGKRPPLIHQECVKFGSSESLYNNVDIPIGRQNHREKRKRSLAVGNRNSTLSVDSLEEQNTSNNFLDVRISRHLSPKSSIDSGSSTFSVDSLEEPVPVNRTAARRTGHGRSKRSGSFQSNRSSTISTDSLEEQYSGFLEHEKGV